MPVDHFMVEYVDGGGDTRFANDTHLIRRAALGLARNESRKHGAAFAVAYESAGLPGMFRAVGHVAYVGGVRSENEGVTK